MFKTFIHHPGLLLIQTWYPSEHERNLILSWLILPTCLSPEGRVSVHTQVWSWLVSQKQQVCISILRTGKCSWVLQFTHTHGVPNRIYSHEGTLSAGVNLYHSTVFKGIAYFYKQKKISLTTFSSYVSVVFCFSENRSYFLRVTVLVAQINNRN